MSIFNIIVALVFTYYTFYATKLFDKNNRNQIKEKNISLDKLRTKPIKTLEEQKIFLDTKNPYIKWKWDKKNITEILWQLVMYVIFINLYLKVFEMSNLEWELWNTILVMVFLPLILGLILGQFNLQKSDLLVFFRGAKKNDNNRQTTKGQKGHK